MSDKRTPFKITNHRLAVHNEKWRKNQMLGFNRPAYHGAHCCYQYNGGERCGIGCALSQPMIDNIREHGANTGYDPYYLQQMGIAQFEDLGVAAATQMLHDHLTGCGHAKTLADLYKITSDKHPIRTRRVLKFIKNNGDHPINGDLYTKWTEVLREPSAVPRANPLA